VTDSVDTVSMRVNCIWRVLDQIMVEMFMFFVSLLRQVLRIVL